ncbi:SDR family NAD(P)-dependent oxidoreductase, partial [Ralstonia solanacearum]|uniref:SDR family NAD(P)-dependent oxidoreductase n=1 Tax=Ralstonia solanacearum TaxID=305 RepID=UPI0001816D29
MATLAGHHAVVTGAGRGIGAAIAARLAADGAPLTLMGRNAAVLEAAAATLPAAARARVVPCDVADAATVMQAFASARAGLGPVSILLNHAGHAESASFAETTLDPWHRMLADNQTGPFLCTPAALVDVHACGRGHI